MIFCVLYGHNYTNEMQVTAQVFFPNERFTFCDEIPAEGLAVVGCVRGCCIGEMYRDGKKISSYSLEIPDSDEKAEKTVKRTLMLAVFYALKEATGLPTPWGALTGVHPAKQVRLWLEEGDTEEEIFERLSKIYGLRDDKIKLATTVAYAERAIIARQSPGVGLYIGVPFCPSRCLYCSFVVSQKAGPDAHRRFLDALAKECQVCQKSQKSQESQSITEDSINTVYIGGGTPTAFSEEDLLRLLEIVSRFIKLVNLSTNVEYTVEAGRPDSITPEKLKLLKNFGVNRIAINPQTLNDITLERIGRSHTAADFYRAYEMAKQAGFDNINTDVIAGLPGEEPEDMRRTMEGLKGLKPTHITVHTLAVKRASRLNERLTDYHAAEFETVDTMLDIAREICGDLGLVPYYMYRQKNMVGHFENVGYSLPGYECLYNVAMMAETQTVLGAGAGAVTKYVENGLIRRKFNPKDVEAYIQLVGKSG